MRRRAEKKNKAPGVDINQVCKHLSVDMIESVSVKILDLLQTKYFQIEIEAIKKAANFSNSSSICKLNPFADHCGILRVGGRIQNSTFVKTVHPILLQRIQNLLN